MCVSVCVCERERERERKRTRGIGKKEGGSGHAGGEGVLLANCHSHTYSYARHSLEEHSYACRLSSRSPFTVPVCSPVIDTKQHDSACKPCTLERARCVATTDIPTVRCTVYPVQLGSPTPLYTFPRKAVCACAQGLYSQLL